MADGKTDITLLCKVVDNYGDIGFVYRLARSLSQIADDSVSLRIVVSDLISFSKMAPLVKTDRAFQKVNLFGKSEWEVYDWNNDSVCKEAFTQKEPEVILECFQCGRPDWLEEILFAPDRSNTVHVVNVEYLTAEDYADDFHLLNSLTRSSHVRKINFMPGFTSKTGGLVLDEPFVSYMHKRSEALKVLGREKWTAGTSLSSEQPADSAHQYNVLVFSYEREYESVVKALVSYQEERRAKDKDFCINIFLASGLSSAPFKKAAAALNAPLNVIELPFINQNTWDALLTLMDFSFVRGEDSLSRACLSSVPFVWHAYLQDEEYQLVKVKALLERMKPFFNAETYALLKKYWLLYNINQGKKCGNEALEVLNEAQIAPETPKMAPQGRIQTESDTDNLEKTELLCGLLRKSDELRAGFAEFTKNLENNGNLAVHLLEYVKQLQF